MTSGTTVEIVAEKKNEKESDDEEKEDDEIGEESDPKQKNPQKKPTVIQQPLSFKNVEDLYTFSGDGKQSVRKRLEDFNEVSEICLWSESQKIIYAKKLLKGSAKLSVTYEKCCATWKLEKALTSEFDKILNSRQVHKELTKTKKKSDESYHDYVYKMMEIASHSEIEMETKIQYIIDGIQDKPVNKSILYGAQNIKELLKRLTQYKAMKNSANQKSKSYATKFDKEATKESYDTKERRKVVKDGVTTIAAGRTTSEQVVCLRIKAQNVSSVSSSDMWRQNALRIRTNVPNR